MALAACQWNFRWRDTTNQGRSTSEARSDQSACGRESGADKLGDMTFKDNAAEEAADEAVWKRIEACMSKRGWLPDNPPWANEN